MSSVVPSSRAQLHCVTFIEKSPTEQYARVSLGPLEVGQGVPLGSTLRHFLLTEVPGVTITAAQLNGVPTQFTTVPGVRESVAEIFLNLSQVVFYNIFPAVLHPLGGLSIDPRPALPLRPLPIAHTDIVVPVQVRPEDMESNIHLDLQPSFGSQAVERWEGPADELLPVRPFRDPGPMEALPPYTRVVRAGDLSLPDHAVLVDPTQPILTIMDPNTEINLGFTLGQGKGYTKWRRASSPKAAVEFSAPNTPFRQLSENQGDIFQPIDANYMPVLNVNFKVHTDEAQGHVVGYPPNEYVYFEITTNGSIHPFDAIKYASAVLLEIVRPLSIANPALTTLSFVQQAIDAPRTNTKEHFETVPIEQLELSLRAYNCLKRAQILLLSDLSQESQQSLLALRNFGQKSLDEVTKALDTYGIALVQEGDIAEG
jgi:DNA-directed RNA polymerase alpha subunit